MIAFLFETVARLWSVGGSAFFQLASVGMVAALAPICAPPGERIRAAAIVIAALAVAVAGGPV